MRAFTWSQIKFERLFLAIALTFALADNVPHPRLGPSLTSLGMKQLQTLLIPDYETEGAVARR